MKKIFVSALCLFLAVGAFAQQLPNGVIVYALPKTTLRITAEARREVFTAGPYAKFAPKYLGLEVPVENRETCTLRSVDLQWLVEADATQTYTVAVKDSKAATNFLTMTATGLVALFENAAAAPAPWRFATAAREQDFHNRGPESNLAKENSTFYKTVKTDNGFERVPVQQSQLVEKNIERRAEETANAIYTLRKKRMELITGDSDNIPSGDGLRAALEAIDALEREYLSLFVGKSSCDTQIASFEVIPDPGQAKQLYVAFRLSDTQGLVASDNMAGRPVVLDLTPTARVGAMPSNAEDTDKGKRVCYRIPEVCQARLIDGQNTLLQQRVPVYQLGKTMTFPL